MGFGVNKVTLLGYVGKDPEVRAIPSGTKVANFSLATDESYTDKNNQKVDKVEWHNLVAWSGLAGIVEKYVRKGSKLYIEGHIQTRTWDDQSTGKKQYRTEIVVDELRLLGDKGGAQSQARSADPDRQEQPQQRRASRPGVGADDELPF
jgi:single-strand DNA-binding protein